MNDPDNDPETGEVYSGKPITVDGKAIKVYAIGAGSWCWDPPR